jgi:hypothetical protein
MMVFSRVHTLLSDKKIVLSPRLSKMRYTSSTGNVSRDEAMLMDTDICFLYVVTFLLMKYIYIEIFCYLLSLPFCIRVINFSWLCNFMLM